MGSWLIYHDMLLFLYVYILNMYLRKYWREIGLLIIVLGCIYMLYDTPVEGFTINNSLSDIIERTTSALNEIRNNSEETGTVVDEIPPTTQYDDNKAKRSVCVPDDYESRQKSSSSRKSSRKKRYIK
jgi:hypothetical protein